MKHDTQGKTKRDEQAQPNKRRARLAFLAAVMLLSAVWAAVALTSQAKSAPITYLSTPEELKEAIIRHQETIYVDDITFDEPETVAINYSVTVIGKSEKSTIKNLCLTVVGSLTVEDKPKITFENIKFDGGFDKTKYDLTQEMPFGDLFGADGNRQFLSNNIKQDYMGYYDIHINNCEITNYISEEGAVIDLRDDKSENGKKNVSIKNSKIYGNVGEEKILRIGNRKIVLTIENAELYDNYAVFKMASIAHASVEINGLHIHDNHFLPLDSAEYSAQKNSMFLIHGGEIYFSNTSGIVKNMTVEDGETYYGGGMFLALSKPTQGGKMVFADCVFKNNKARISGGAVGIESYVGYPVYFTNCRFIGNTAPTGGSICAKPRDWETGNTCLIEFSFCDFSENTAEDDRALAYYLDEITKTKTDGKIVVRACRIEDSTFLPGNGEKENNYNIVSPTAITDNSEITVPPEEYTLWANGYYTGKTEARSIGYTEPPQSEKISPVQPILYGLCTLFSLLIALVYLCKSTEKHKEMIFISASVALINLGYLLLSVSGNITSALLFNSIAYLGNAFLPLFFMMAVANVCRYKVRKVSKIILSAITVVSFLFTLTVWFSGWFYQDPTYAVIRGAVDIVKENGILHLIYRLYVFAYFIVIFGIVLYSLLKKQLEHKKYGLLIFSAELVCLLVWTVEMFVSVNYELLSVAYVLTSLLMTVLFFEMERYGILTSIREVLIGENEQPQASGKGSPAWQTDAERLEMVCNSLVERRLLSKREVEVLALVMQEKSTDQIVETLFISNNTVKYHIKNIYAKLSVKNREELRFRMANELQHLE